MVDAYRFDDPDGRVGIETHLLTTTDGKFLQVPVTYRDAPLAGAEDALITTMEHSVLGTRWVYDATADEVYLRALLAAVLTGGHQAAFEVQTDDGPQDRPATMLVRGSGAPGADVPALTDVSRHQDGAWTVVRVGGLEIVVRHVLDGTAPDGAQTLIGTWTGHDEPAVLAVVG